MKVIAFAIILSFVVAGVVAAADAPKINLSVKAMSLKDVTDEMAKQAGIAVVLDPKAKGTVTVTLNDAEVGQVLDVITKPNNLTWKKLQFAKSQDTKITLDQLKSGIVALASMPLMGLAVEDPATKMCAVFAKDVPSTQDTSKVGLAPGYSWNTVYVILSPEAPAATAKSTGADKVQSLSQTQAQSVVDLAGMSSDERRQVYQNQWLAAMRLTPSARQGMLRDQMAGMAALEPQARSQLMRDMQTAMRGMFGSSGRSNRSRGN